MKFFDLFAGVGGFRFGMEAAGHECIGFCEIDKFARESYKAIHNTEGEIEVHDATGVTKKEIEAIGQVDVICAGFPCQPFSVAGARRGFEDTNGTLFFEIARFASMLKPKYLFLENVKGLISHDKGYTFETIIGSLDELGFDVEWQVLNSKDFGVPQNRERCFVIGHLRGRGSTEVFPVERADGENRVQIIGHKDGYRRNTQVFASNGITETLDTGQGGGRGQHVALPCFIDLCTSGTETTNVCSCLQARYHKGVGTY